MSINKKLIISIILLIIGMVTVYYIVLDINKPTMGMAQWVKLMVIEFVIQTALEINLRKI